MALFAREENRSKAPAAVHEAVKRAGGQIVAQSTVKPWELGKWAREQATRMGISLDTAAANALVAQVGGRQQRLLRELEKLALDFGPGASIDAEQVEELTAASAEADLIVLGSQGGHHHDSAGGSVLHALLAHAHCPVFVVPENEQAPNTREPESAPWI